MSGPIASTGPSPPALRRENVTLSPCSLAMSVVLRTDVVSTRTGLSMIGLGVSLSLSLLRSARATAPIAAMTAKA